MEPKTKLEIIGPYTLEHEGPFCTRDGQKVRLITRTEGHHEFPIVGIVENDTGALVWDNSGLFFGKGQRDNLDLMNAREVPMPLEFWVNEYTGVVPKNAVAHRDERDARSFENDPSYIRTIHVREVLPGDGE